MNKVEYLKPTEELIFQIADDMRDADKVEIWASHHVEPIEALMAGWKDSDYTAVVVINGDPCAMIGLTIQCIATGYGVPWMLATNSALKHKREFLKESVPGVEWMRSICPNLINYVHDKNKVSIKWLKWLGFVVENPSITTAEGEKFCKFYIGDLNV